MNKITPVQSIEVPGYEGRSVRIDRGQRVRVIDVEGAQVGDLFAMCIVDHHEYLSPAVTRLVNHCLFPRVEQKFYTNRHRPILSFLEDHSPGFHDMLFAPCDARLYQERGFTDPHPNCRDNYARTAQQAGVQHDIVPDPVNLFQNTPVNADHTLSLNTTATKPGDFVILEAEMDMILVLTACSSERINDGTSTPLRIEIYDN
ncbi:MAG: urea carboxylase-associated family protein [Gammaproteobacteria bacterium]|nr:urea carboxylase-associated family protein [Gammaproteobacteria bacterium]